VTTKNAIKIPESIEELREEIIDYIKAEMSFDEIIKHYKDTMKDI
jgi:sRNA-binding carbon storage regulator CsrA